MDQRSCWGNLWSGYRLHRRIKNEQPSPQAHRSGLGSSSDGKVSAGNRLPHLKKPGAHLCPCDSL